MLTGGVPVELPNLNFEYEGVKKAVYTRNDRIINITSTFSSKKSQLST